MARATGPYECGGSFAPRSYRSVGAGVKVKYGFARVPADDQNFDMQIEGLYRAGCRTMFTDEGLA
jgi:hypothetical protein